MKDKKRSFMVKYIGVSDPTKGNRYSPIRMDAFSFMEAACLAVAQVEYQEPGNFTITSIQEVESK